MSKRLDGRQGIRDPNPAGRDEAVPSYAVPSRLGPARLEHDELLDELGGAITREEFYRHTA